MLWITMRQWMIICKFFFFHHQILLCENCVLWKYGFFLYTWVCIYGGSSRRQFFLLALSHSLLSLSLWYILCISLSHAEQFYWFFPQKDEICSCSCWYHRYWYYGKIVFIGNSKMRILIFFFSIREETDIAREKNIIISAWMWYHIIMWFFINSWNANF